MAAEIDLINRITYNRKERVRIFREQSSRVRGFLLARFSPHIQAELLGDYSVDEIAEMLDFLDPDQASDVLLNIEPKRRRNAILRKLKEDMNKKVEMLLSFRPNTAASLVSLNYVEVSATATFEEIAKAVERHRNNTGKTPSVLVVQDGLLLGELPLYVLALHRKDAKAAPHAHPIPIVTHKAHPEDALHVFLTSPHKRVVVLDQDQSILGIIYSDDIIRLFQRQPGTSLSEFAGVKRTEGASDSVFSKVKNRWRWLILNLATAFLAAAVVGLFEETLNATVLLVLYMPVIAGMGGNAATQTLAVMVRDIATGEITLQNSFRAIRNEMGAGFFNGAIVGVLVAVVATVWNQAPLLGAVVGIAMVINLVIAGFFGAIIPLVLRQLGKDPATSATIFITTATDVLGFFAFLGLASFVLT